MDWLGCLYAHVPPVALGNFYTHVGDWFSPTTNAEQVQQYVQRYRDHSGSIALGRPCSDAAHIRF